MPEKYNSSKRRQAPPDAATRGLMDALRLAKETESLRSLAARIGISHYALWKLFGGGTASPATIRRIQEWLKHPGEDDAVQEFRESLRRVLSRLGAGRTRRIEGLIGELLRQEFEAAALEVPRWVRSLGKKQV